MGRIVLVEKLVITVQKFRIARIELQVKATAGGENCYYVSKKKCDHNLIGYSITTTLSPTDNI